MSNGEKDVVKPWGVQADLPLDAIPVHTYREYRALIDKWSTGDVDQTLLVIGAPGIGKTETALASISKHCKRHLYLKGKATQFGVYSQLFEHIDAPVVLDDLDELLSDSSVTALLKMLLETREEKLIQWTNKNTLRNTEQADDKLPAEFKTRSRSLLLVNELKQVSKNFQAVLDRSTVIWFAPSVDEITKYVATWFDIIKHRDVYDFVSERLPLAASPSCRYYSKAVGLKSAGVDWKSMIARAMAPQDAKVAKLKTVLADKSLTSRKAQYAAWSALVGGASEQAFYGYLRAAGIQTGERSARGKAIAEAMRRKHAARRSTDA